MAEAYLIDTTILVDFLRGKKEAQAWLENFAEGELAISVITAAELLAGCRNRRGNGSSPRVWGIRSGYIAKMSDLGGFLAIQQESCFNPRSQ